MQVIGIPTKTMEGTESEAINAVAREATDFLWSRLRTEFPFMRVDELKRMIDQHIGGLAADMEKQAPAMEAAKSRISFLSLPPEIRNHIYELTFTPSSEERQTTLISERDNRPKLPGLLYTSRQIRSESVPIYFATTTFEIRLAGTGSLSYLAVEWLKAIGPANAKHIKTLRICFGAIWGLEIDVGLFLGKDYGVDWKGRARVSERSPTKRDVLDAYYLSGLGIAATALEVGSEVGRDKEWEEMQLDD